MPNGVRSLLGLGLNYCIQTPAPSNDLEATIERFTNDVRRVSFFVTNPPEPEDPTVIRYIPELYIKSDWTPPTSADPQIEDCIDSFARELRQQQSRYIKPTPSNLRPRQWKLSKALKFDDTFIAIEADKNLGGCLLHRSTYTSRGISEHLGDTSVYKPLSKVQAYNHLKIINRKLSIFLSKRQDEISSAEFHFLWESLHKNSDNMARFRMSLKAHKNPWKMRPIVCCAGTALNDLSRWLDYWLQKLKPFLPTYIRDSTQLLDQLKDLGPLPPGAKVFTADANSMYTNIDTDHAIDVIGKWLDSLEGRLPPNFPLAAVKEAMKLVMRNNLFEYGDLYFLQLLGTAMGTSAACMWATIYYSVHEIGSLLPNYGKYLLIFKRFIDDMFGIWYDNGNPTAWDNFKAETNNFGILTWEFEEPAKSINFLDLTIILERSNIRTKTYQKDLNLYQYIMPQSNHPPRMMKGIIYSLMRNYKKQNSNYNDYKAMATKLFYRHINRGWDRSTMKQWILSADEKIQLETLQKNQPTTTITAPPTEEPLTNKERIFLHFEYHKNDIPKSRVRAIYENKCQTLLSDRLGIQQLTIAYSRPKNIKDTITKAKLHQAPGFEASKYYSGELPPA